MCRKEELMFFSLWIVFVPWVNIHFLVGLVENIFVFFKGAGFFIKKKMGI